MSLPPDIFLDKLQRDLNDVGIENVTFALITSFYPKFCFFFQTSVRPRKHQVKQLADCCIVYMECIRNYVVNTSTLQQRQVEAVKKFIQIVETMPNLEGVRNDFVQNIATAIFQTVTDPEIQLWFGKEVLSSFTRAVQHTNSDLRNKIAKQNLLYLCKLMDLLSTCGDYEYELILMETIFRLCSDTQISNYASTLFPECEMLQKAVCNIDRNHFDRDLREFLNSVNNKSKKVFSIKCDFVFLENIEVAAPKEYYGDQLPFWVDFNTGSKTVTFKCDRDSLRTTPPSTDDSALGEWETVTIEYSNVKKVLTSRLLVPVSGRSQGSIVFFSLTPPCGVLYSTSFEAARAAHLKLAIYQCPELLQLETEILPSMYCGKFQNLMPSSQDSSSSSSQPKKKRVLTFGRGSTKPAYKPLKTRKVSISHSKNMDGVSSVSDAMSLKNRLLESDVNTMRRTDMLRRERSPVSKSPVIRNIKELQEAAADLTYTHTLNQKSNENEHIILEQSIEDVCDHTEITKPNKSKITVLSEGVLKNGELDNTNSSLLWDATVPLDLNTTCQSVGSLSDSSEISELSKDQSVQQNHDSFINDTRGFNPERTNDNDNSDILPATENFETIVEKTDLNNENISDELDSNKKKPAKEIIKVKWPKCSISVNKVLKQKRTFKSPVRGEIQTKEIKTPKTKSVQKKNLEEEESNVIEDTKAEKVSKTVDKKSDKLELQRSEVIAKGDVGKPTKSAKSHVEKNKVYDFEDETELALQIASPKERKPKTSKLQAKQSKSVQKMNLEEEESNVMEDTKAEKVSKTVDKKSDKLELQRSEVIAKGDVGKPTKSEKTEVQRDDVFDFVDETELALQIAPKESKSKSIETLKIQTEEIKTPKTKRVQKKKNFEEEESNVIEDTKAEKISKTMDKKSDKLELQRSEVIAKGDVGKPTKSAKSDVQKNKVYDFEDETELALQIGSPKERKPKTSKLQVKQTKSVQKKKNLEEEESNVMEDTKVEKVSKTMDKKSDKLELQRSEVIAKGGVGKPIKSATLDIQKNQNYDLEDETDLALQIGSPKERKPKTSKLQAKQTKSVQKKNLEEEESNVMEDTKVEKVSKTMDKKSDKLELQRSEVIAKGGVGKPTESATLDIQKNQNYDLEDETDLALQIGSPKERKPKTSKLQAKQTKSVQKKKNLEEEESNVMEDTKVEKVSKTMDKKSDKLELQRSEVIAKRGVGKPTESATLDIQKNQNYDLEDETDLALQIGSPKELKPKTSKLQAKQTKSVQKKKNLEEEESNVMEDTKVEKVSKTMDKKSDKLELQRSEVIAKGGVGKPTESATLDIQKNQNYDLEDETDLALQIGSPKERKPKTLILQAKQTKSVQKKKNLEEEKSNLMEDTKAEKVSKTMAKKSDKLELQRSEVIAKADVGKPTESEKTEEVYDFVGETGLALEIAPKESKSKCIKALKIQTKETKTPRTRSMQKKKNLEEEKRNVTEDTKAAKVSKTVDKKSNKLELQRSEVIAKEDVRKPTKSAKSEVQTGELIGFEDEALQVGAPNENKPKETKTPKTKSVQKQIKPLHLEEEESNLLEGTKAEKVSFAMDSKFNKPKLQTSEVVLKRDLRKPTESVKSDVQTGEVIGFEDEALQIGAPKENKSKSIKKPSKIQTKETKTPKISVQKQNKNNLEEEERNSLEDIIAWKIPKVVDSSPEPPLIKAKDEVKVTKQKRAKPQTKEKKPSKSHKKDSMETIPSKLQVEGDAEPILLQTRSSELHVEKTFKSIKSKLTIKKRGKSVMDAEDEQPQAGTSVLYNANDESSIDKPVLTAKKGRIYDSNETASEDVINIQPNVPSEILTNSPKNIYPFDEDFLPELKKHTAIVMSQESDDIYLDDLSPQPQANISAEPSLSLTPDVENKSQLNKSITLDVTNNEVKLCSPSIHEKQPESQQKQSQDDLFDVCFKEYLDEIENAKATKQSHAENYEIREVPDSKDVHQMTHDEEANANNCINELDALELPKIPEDEFQSVRQSDNVNEEETNAKPKIKILHIHLIRGAFDKEKLEAQAKEQNKTDKKCRSTIKRKSNKKEALDKQLSPHKSPTMNDYDKSEDPAEKANKQQKLEEPKSSKQKLNKKSKSSKTVTGNKTSDIITTWQKASEEITISSLPDLLKDAEKMEINFAKNTIENKEVEKAKEESNLKLVAEFDQDNDPEMFNKSTQELQRALKHKQEEINFSESNFEKSSKKRRHSESNLDEPPSKNFKPVDNGTPTTIKKSKKLPRRRLFNPNTIYVVNESTATDKSNSLQQTLLSDDLEPLPVDNHREEMQASKSAVSLEIEEDGLFDKTIKSISTMVREKNADKCVRIPVDNQCEEVQEPKNAVNLEIEEDGSFDKTMKSLDKQPIPTIVHQKNADKCVGIPQQNKTLQEFNWSTADKYLKDKQRNFSSSHGDSIQIENHKNKTDVERPHIPLKPLKRDVQKTTTTELSIKKSKPQVDQRRDSLEYNKNLKTVEYDEEFPVCRKRTSLVDYVFGDYKDSSTRNEQFDLCIRSICESLDKASASHPKLKVCKNKSKKYRSLSPAKNKEQKPKRKYSKLCGDKSKQQKQIKKVKEADAKSLIKQSKPLSKNRNEESYEIECHTSEPQNSINDLLTRPVWKNKPSKRGRLSKKRSSDEYHPVPPHTSILEPIDDLIQNQNQSGTATVSVEKLKSLMDLIVQNHIQLYNILIQFMTPIKNNPQHDFSKTVVILNKFINLLNTYPKM